LTAFVPVCVRGSPKALRRSVFRRRLFRMLRKTLTRAAVACAVAGGVVAGAATPALAPKYILGASAYGTCGVAGEPLFNGDFTVESFTAKGGQLLAVAMVAGSCVDGLDVAGSVPPGVYAFPVAATTECVPGSAVVEIRPGAATVAGDLGGEKTEFTLDLSSTVVDRIWMEGDPASERARICAVGRASGRSAAQRARLLNALVLRI
jgi:hypothetical protein